MLNDTDCARVLPALLALRTQKHGVADLEKRMEKHQEHAIDVVLQRGIDEGRLAPDIALDHATALLVGPLLFASIMEKPPIDEAFCDHVIDVFLQTSAPPA